MVAHSCRGIYARNVAQRLRLERQTLYMYLRRYLLSEVCGVLFIMNFGAKCSVERTTVLVGKLPLKELYCKQ
jgi:hypothetical protein